MDFGRITLVVLSDMFIENMEGGNEYELLGFFHKIFLVIRNVFLSKMQVIFACIFCAKIKYDEVIK